MQTLIMCEKPDAAARVARALDEDGDPRRTETQGVPIYESRNRNETILVCSALGHLYAVDSKTRTSRRFYPVWDFEWKPKHLIDKKSARLGRWIQVISSLANKADRYINACDYDVEGSLIGYTLLRYACHGADSKAQRMKFSTLTEKELKSAYRNLAPQLDMPLVEAGRTRHELDWLYGIHLSRLLTESAPIQNRRNRGEAVPWGVDLLSTYFEPEAASRHRIFRDSPRHREHASVQTSRLKADPQQFTPPQSRSQGRSRTPSSLSDRRTAQASPHRARSKSPRPNHQTVHVILRRAQPPRKFKANSQGRASPILPPRHPSSP